MSASDAPFEVSLALLEPAANIGYGKQPLPSGRDEELRTLLEETAPASLAKAITPDNARVLRVFAERAASLAIRRADAKLLHMGLMALALADPMSKETMSVLALYVDAAERLHIDALPLFRSAGRVINERSADLLAAFAKRSPEDRSLQSMGYRSEGEGAEFRYVRDW